MSIHQAQQWLETHSPIIPALSVNQHEIIHLLEQQQKSHKPIQFTVRDPGLLLALLSKVNASRGKSSSRDIVESPRAAMALLGEQVSHTLFKDFTVAEIKLKNPQQLFLFKQIANRSLHNDTQAERWAQECGFQQLEQLRATALLAYIGELLCCVHDYNGYLKTLEAGGTEQVVNETFGFSYSELTEALCRTLNLPELITRSLPHKKSSEQRARLLYFTASLCRLCESGWYTIDMQKTLEEFSRFLQLPLDKVIQKTHFFSVSAARNSIVEDAWQPASRLLLINDAMWKPKSQALPAIKPTQENADQRETVTPSEAHEQDALNKIKQMVKQADVSQSDLVNTCLKGLLQDTGLTRVSLLLLSKDKKWLQNRMTIGTGSDSTFQKYRIELEKSGLLKMLLNKPQAIWINDNSYKKYQKLIPQSLMAAIMTDDFLVMSLFIGAMPLGLIYADRSNSPQPVDQQVFTQFKQLISLTSKALTFLAKK